MKFTVLKSVILAMALCLASGAQAADKGGYYDTCVVAEDAAELLSYQSVRMLRQEVHQRFEHAAEVSKSSRAIASQSPLFVWANEAKISCAKAYGYLRRARKWRKRPDYVMLQKCDCFYQRMTRYLGY